MVLGIGSNILDAYTKAYDADPVSAFGGIVALNRAVDKATAEKIGAIFIEAVIAPSYAVEAIEILTQKKNIRLLTLDMPESGRDKCLDTKKVSGGMLLQEADTEDALDRKYESCY